MPNYQPPWQQAAAERAASREIDRREDQHKEKVLTRIAWIPTVALLIALLNIPGATRAFIILPEVFVFTMALITLPFYGIYLLTRKARHRSLTAKREAEIQRLMHVKLTHRN